LTSASYGLKFGHKEEIRAMQISSRHCFGTLVLLLMVLLGCTALGPGTPPLTAAQARQTLDSWNPNYCKVIEFYGFHRPVEGTLVAYVLLTNPSDKAHKPMMYVAKFQLLTLADGAQKWYLTSLINHASGLTRRQGWDNLLIPVEKAASPASR
jgi:hypothetical protein